MPLRTLVVGAAVLSVIAIVVAFDPLAALVGAIPWPGLPAADLPDLPSWVKWLWRGLMISAVALAVAGALRGTDSDQADPNDEPQS